MVDPDVGAVGRRQREAVPEPDHRGAGVGLHLAADVGRVPLPRVDRHQAEHLGSICSATRREEEEQEHSGLVSFHAPRFLKAALVGFLVLLFFHTVFLLSIMTKQHHLEMILSGSAAGISNLSNIFQTHQPTKPSPVVENLPDCKKIIFLN